MPKIKEPVEEVLYPHITTTLCASPNRDDVEGWDNLAPMTAESFKELIGWEVVTNTNNYLLVDKLGNKVRCRFNLKNRPYRANLAEDWMLEILRGKWQLNGETIIIDKQGFIHDGQHRGIGLILAEQEWELDSKRPKPEQKWQEQWPDAPCIETLVVTGIDGSDAVVNTIGTGKPRTLDDVLYRCNWFATKPEKERMCLANVTSNAIKLLWARTAQSLVSFAPRRPHSESLEFIERHPKLLECVQFIAAERVGKLKPLVSSGVAAGLLYLMGASSTDEDKYHAVNSEDALDWEMWDKAQAYFVDFYSEGKKTECIREAFLDDTLFPQGVAGRYSMELKISLLVKGWLMFSLSPKKKITRDDLEVETGISGDGVYKVLEQCRIGGIDCGSAVVGKG